MADHSAAVLDATVSLLCALAAADNRRYDLAAMIPRLAWAAVRTPPMPYRLLKLPEVYG